MAVGLIAIVHGRLSGHLGWTLCRCSKSGCPSTQLRLSTTCPKRQLGVLVYLQEASRAGSLWVRGTSRLSQVSSGMVGSISRLPFLNTILETVIFAQLCAADKAHLRSHSGAGCAEALSRCPTAPEFALQPIIPHSRVGNSAHSEDIGACREVGASVRCNAKTQSHEHRRVRYRRKVH